MSNKLPQVQTYPIHMRGGMDLATPHDLIASGYVTEALNFEALVNGGVRLINGYERTHGNAVLSSNKWYALRCSDVSDIALNASITDASSGATAYVFAKDETNNQLGITNISGTFGVGNGISGYPGVTISAMPVERGCIDYTLINQWQLASDNYYRASITPIPGSGNVLGIWCYKGSYYGFRSNGANVLMYRANGSGWTLIPFFRVLKFDTGVLSEGDILEGDTIVGGTSGAIAVVKRFIKNDGSYGSTAAGYMVVSVTGAFIDNELIKKGGVTKMTANGVDTAISFAVGANKFQFVNYNFKASSDNFRMYGCDGVNPAFEFDGTVLTPILLPSLPDAPVSNNPMYISAHNNYLWLAFPKGSLQKSVIGDPLVWSGFLGAANYSMGDEIVGMAPILDSMLFVTTRSSIRGISGMTELDFKRQIIAEDTGCIDNTTAISIRPYVLSQKGIIRLDATQAYGNFQSNSVSRLVWPMLEAAIGSKTIIGAGISRLKNQYKIYFSDGTGVIMTQDALLADQSLPSFTTFQYYHKPTCISSVDVSDTEEVLLFGDKDGYVYRENTGNNCDGQPIEYALRTKFEHLNSPSVRKTFKRAEFDINGDGNSDIRFSYELSYGQQHTVRSAVAYINSIGLGGYWGVNNWGEFYWSSPIISQKIVSITGTGHNISMLFYGKSATTDPFTLNSITLHYLTRRLNRG